MPGCDTAYNNRYHFYLTKKNRSSVHKGNNDTVWNIFQYYVHFYTPEL